MSKTYILLKPFPGIEVGTELVESTYGIPVIKSQIGNGYPFFYCPKGEFGPLVPVSIVEGNPDWFQLKEDGLTGWLKSMTEFYNSEKKRIEDSWRQKMQDTDKAVRDQLRQADSPAADMDYEIINCISADRESIHAYRNGICLGAIKDIPPCDIYSVKRLKDGVVFTINDEVMVCYADGRKVIGPCTINNFLIQKNGIVAYHTSGDAYISDLQHTKDKPVFNAEAINKRINEFSLLPVLFKTEDGYEILNTEQKLYSVCTKWGWQTRDDLTYTTMNWRQRYFTDANIDKKHFKEGWKHFANPAARAAYVRKNKPALSLSEVSKWLKSHTNASIADYSPLNDIILSKKTN